MQNFAKQKGTIKIHIEREQVQFIAIVRRNKPALAALEVGCSLVVSKNESLLEAQAS